MIKWLHIISVGTSVIRNYAKETGEKPKSVDDILQLVKRDPKLASAELNAFLRFVSGAGHAPPSDVGVHLISTDTDDCELAGKAIREYLRLEGYSVTAESPERVRYLGASEDVFEEGLAHLVDAYLAAVRRVEEKYPGVRVYLNLTGGFKAEASVLLLAAAVSGAVAAYYIHENFREVVTVPLPPLTVDKKLVELVIKYLRNKSAWDCELFHEEASSRELDPRKLLEDGLFLSHKDCAPRRWLTSLVAVRYL